MSFNRKSFEMHTSKRRDRFTFARLLTKVLARKVSSGVCISIFLSLPNISMHSGSSCSGQAAVFHPDDRSVQGLIRELEANCKSEGGRHCNNIGV